MKAEEIIASTVKFVKEELKNAEGGHDWWHIERVWKNTLLIARDENADLLIAQLGALLHDIADSKFHDGDETIGPRKARVFLEQLHVTPEVINGVIGIIEHISFKGGHFERDYYTPELAVVQDADRLDAIGAIGIARAFHYGGFKDREIHNPEITPDLHMDRETYKKNTAPTINHFYEKLLLLKDRMNTAAGKKLAEARHRFMEVYLDQFYAEWRGDA